MKVIASKSFSKARKQHGFLMIDLAVAMLIFTFAMLPLAFSFNSDAKFLHIEYQRATASEIVDSEMEILAAGDWTNFPDGTSDYPVRLNAAANLPPGKFQLTRNGNHLRLEWKSDQRVGVGAVAREIIVK